jgi:hypothetical protein
MHNMKNRAVLTRRALHQAEPPRRSLAAATGTQ